MTTRYDGVGDYSLPISEADAKKVAHSKPTLCAVRQPWKKEGVTIEDIALDLIGCITSHWNNYREAFKADYSLCEAFSDAVVGIEKAILKDAVAPSGGKALCECGCEFPVPKHLPDDEEQNALFRDAPFGKCPPNRVIKLECPECGSEVTKRIIKTIFSTHVFSFIRAEIQRGARLASGKKGTVSISNPYGESGSTIEDSLTVEECEQDQVPKDIMRAIHECIEDLSPSSRRVLGLRYGFGGLCDDVIQTTVSCRHCNEEFKAVIDYSKSHNSKECPHCNAENHLAMERQQTEIAKILNVSKQRVCALIKKAHDRLSTVIPVTNLYT